MAINTPSADKNDPSSRETAQKMSVSDGVSAESPKSPEPIKRFVKKRPSSSINPLTGDGFQQLLKSYYGTFYLDRASKSLGIPKRTLHSIIHQNRTIQPQECTKFLQTLPKLVQEMKEWTERRKSYYDIWFTRQELRAVETAKLLAHMQREAERIAAAKRR